MQGIPLQLEAAIILAVEGLKREQAPTSIGYNDMAVMIAYGQSERGIPTVDKTMVAEFLRKHPAVPEDARMTPDVVQTYLDVLADAALLERQGEPTKYRMRDDTSALIVNETDRLKSIHIDDFLFHGFRLHGSWAIDREKRASGVDRFY